MKNLFSYKDFINEKIFINEAKKSDPKKLFIKDIKTILDEMFVKSSKQKYEYDKDGYPTKIEFEINETDFSVDYDDLKNEYSEGVLKKREVLPILIFDEKKKDKSTFIIKFNIKKENVDSVKKELKEKNPRKEQFNRDSDKQLLSKLKSKKTTVADKEKIMDVLKNRGVDYVNPFKEDDNNISEEDMEKEAQKAAKNESIINEALLGKIAKLFSKKEYEKTLNYCYKECCKDDEYCSLSDIKDCLKNMVFSKITKKALENDTKLFNSLADEIHKDCKKKCEKSNESSFGSEKWDKKYNINVKKEEAKVNFNSFVNETKIKKFDEIETLTEKVNKITYTQNKPLDTEKK